MHQTVNATVQADKNAKIGDWFDFSGDTVIFVMAGGKIIPRVRRCLFHAQRDTPAFFIDVQDDDFDFFAQGDKFIRVDVFIGPVHFRDMDQSLNTIFNFDEATVVGDIGNRAE